MMVEAKTLASRTTEHGAFYVQVSLHVFCPLVLKWEVCCQTPNWPHNIETAWPLKMTEI